MANLSYHYSEDNEKCQEAIRVAQHQGWVVLPSERYPASLALEFEWGEWKLCKLAS